MIWLVPAALLGLGAIAGPLLVHLLLRQRAQRIVVPSVRFMNARRRSSVRLRRLSDPWLLLIRAAIIGCAALALAQPVFLTEASTTAWSKRIARAVVVDRSESVREAIPPAVVQAESVSADFSRVFEEADLRVALRDAARWLSSSAPAKREIVVLSDFQLGALGQGDVARVPDSIGLRLIRIPSHASASGNVPTLRVLQADGVIEGRPEQTPRGVAITFAPGPAAGGLRILGVPNDERVATLLGVVARAGAVAPAADQPIVLRFGAGDRRIARTDGSGDWTFGAAQRLLRSADIIGAPFTISTESGVLIVDAQTEPGSVSSAEILKAALDARVDPKAMAEHEVSTIPPDILAAWSREPGQADPGAWHRTDDSDGRWLWAAVLVLLALESAARRPRAAQDREQAHVA